MNKKHKYEFCTSNLASGNVYYKDVCVENPHATTDPVTGQPLRHYHPSLNSAGLIYCVLEDHQTSDLYLGGNRYQPLRYFLPNGTPYLVFNPIPQTIEADVESATRAWTSCCDKNGEGQIASNTNSGSYNSNLVIVDLTYYRTVTWNYNSTTGERIVDVTVVEVE